MEQPGNTLCSARDPDDLSRRNLLKLAGTGAITLGALTMAGGVGAAEGTPGWDKTFPKSDSVDHRKVAYDNRLGIRLVADLYVPKTLDRSRRYAALVVGTPFGAVKEQASGLYAQTMAERGYVALAHDASYVGESGGHPHRTASAEALVEDFSAGVDFLGSLPFVDRERIGVIGVCGSGGFGLLAAEIDPRIRAVATVAMYDIGQAMRQGLAPTLDEVALRRNLEQVAAQRWAEADGAPGMMAPGTPERLGAASTAVDREFFDYYRTPRGQHPRSTTAFLRTSHAPMALSWSFQNIGWIAPRPVLFVAGETAHSRGFSEQAYRLASEPKELFIVPGAGHVDLYDRMKLIPWDKLAHFFGRSLG